MHVEVVRSPRRRKTVELKPTVDGVVISIPATATKEEEEHYVERLLRRYERRVNGSDLDLMARAKKLAKQYGLPVPQSVVWVENQTTRWGSCTPSKSTIRISSTVAKFPLWVIDYVLVHELAHLLVPGHGWAFWSFVNRYPKTERARGYLIAKGGEDDADGEGAEDQSSSTP